MDNGELRFNHEELYEGQHPSWGWLRTVTHAENEASAWMVATKFVVNDAVKWAGHVYARAFDGYRWLDGAEFSGITISIAFVDPDSPRTEGASFEIDGMTLQVTYVYPYAPLTEVPLGELPWIFQSLLSRIFRLVVAAYEFELPSLRKLPSRWATPTAPPVAELVHPSPLSGVAEMAEDEFWNLIELVGNIREPDDAYARLAAELARRSPEEIAGFQKRLARVLYQLDRREIAAAMGAWETKETGRESTYPSDDMFVYWRCGVVAHGRAAHEGVLEDPRWVRAYIAMEQQDEPLLQVAAVAYRGRTGGTMDVETEYSYESGANAEGWA